MGRVAVLANDDGRLTSTVRPSQLSDKCNVRQAPDDPRRSVALALTRVGVVIPTTSVDLGGHNENPVPHISLDACSPEAHIPPSRLVIFFHPRFDANVDQAALRAVPFASSCRPKFYDVGDHRIIVGDRD
jgi:hypothetical protein